MQWCPSLWTLPGSKQMSFDSFSSTFPASVHEAPVMPYQTIIQTCLTKTCPEISEKLKQITLWENIRQRKWNPENCWCLKETHLLAWSTPICRLQCLQKITQIFCCTAPCWFPAGFPGGLPLLQMIDCNHLIYCSTATWKMPIDIYWIFYRYPFISTRPIPVKLFMFFRKALKFGYQRTGDAALMVMLDCEALQWKEKLPAVNVKKVQTSNRYARNETD